MQCREKEEMVMAKKVKVWFFGAVCLFLAGCGSADRGQQPSVQAADASQEMKMQVTKSVKEGQNVQTKWDGEPEAKEGDGAEDAKNREDLSEDIPKGEEDGGKYKAEFLGVDSTEILSCKVYHGESQEEITPTSARGKYLLQMLSGFLEDPQYEYGFVLGIVDLKEESLEEMAKRRKSGYFIQIQSGQEFSHSFVEPRDRFVKHKSKISNFDSVIVELDQGAGGIFLNYNIDGKRTFHPIGCQNPEMVEGFLEKYKEWENAEDWDAAFAKLEGENQEISGRSAEIWGNLNGAGQEEGGQANFLGIDSAQIQLCRIYHGESQGELNLAEGRGKEFLQKLSTFLGKQKYSDTFCEGGLEDEGVPLEGLGDMAKKQGENYYILFQFSQPMSVYLKEKPEGAFWIHDIDTLVVEVDLDEKILNLNWHNQKELPNDGFFSCIGVHNKKAANDFVAMYEEWGGL